MIDFIHIGYHKTASTWLQNYGFKLHPEIRLVDRDENNPDTRQAMLDLNAEICEVHDLDFSPEKYRERLKGIFSQDSGDESDRKLVKGISNEDFSGNMLNGWNSARNAERLYNIFGKTKVIIMIRNQHDMIESVYRQYVVEGGTFGMKKFLDTARFPLADMLERFKYDKLIHYYFNIFDRENVFTGLYEDFRDDKKAFLSRLYAFLGVDTDFVPGHEEVMRNRKHHRYTILLDRMMNLLFQNAYSSSLFGDWFWQARLKSRSGNYIEIGKLYRRTFIEKILDPCVMYKFFSSKPIMTAKLKQKYLPLFAESNKKLIGIFEEDKLRKYDYPL